MDDVLENAVLQAIVLAFEGDEDDEEHGEGNSFPLVDLEWWRRLGDPFFKKHFRMDRCLFETLLVAVGNHMQATHRLDYPGMAVDVSLFMTLWVLATPDSFRSVGVTFGMAPGSVHNQYKTMIAVLREMRGHYISWPQEREMAIIAREFEERYGYPSVLGCVDGCNIRITAPLEQPQRYINRHHDYSVLLQGTCDDQLIFRDVYIGEPGAVGDNRTFRRSPLGLYSLRHPDFMDEYHLLGDGAFTLTDKMLIPYKDYGNLTERQRQHNRVLSGCRSCIERAFAHLKGKWRRLKYFHSLNPEYRIDSIMASVVLHNFILLEGNQYEDNGFAFDEDGMDDAAYNVLIAEPKARGILKREYIAAMLYRLD